MKVGGRLRCDESGVTLVEVMMAGAIITLVLALSITWFGAVAGMDTFQASDFAALDELRTAKSRLTKELRFADGMLGTTDPTSIEIWVDHDRSGGSGPDQPGERITWEITDTQLIRYEDGDASNAVVVADHLRGEECSISLSADDFVVSVVFVADADNQLKSEVRTISTQVTMRNL
jgi:hypothetical protein